MALHLLGRNPSVRNSVYKLPFGIYAKVVQVPDEALVMDFVRRNTTIPVPTVLDHVFGSWGEYGPWLILMNALPGEPLFQQGQPIRLGTATEQQRLHISHVLSDWIGQLRRIPPPHPQRVSGFLGGPLLSYRIDSNNRVGPFANPAEFHAQEYCTAFPNYPPQTDERTRCLIAERPSKQYRICLTHGDILPHNILADKNYVPTGLVDWECAAWMPEYWERAASFRSHFSRLYGWREIVLNGYPEYDDDMTLEQQIQTWFDAN